MPRNCPLGQAHHSSAFSYNNRCPLKKKAVISLCRIVLVSCQLRGAARLNPPMPPGIQCVQGPGDGVACPNVIAVQCADSRCQSLKFGDTTRTCSCPPPLFPRRRNCPTASALYLLQASHPYPISGIRSRISRRFSKKEMIP